MHHKATIPLIRFGYAKILIHLFSEQGYNLQRILHESGLPSDLYQLDNELLPVEPVRRLLYLIANQVGVTQFGDILRLAFKQQMIPEIAKKFSHCSTLDEALQSAQKIFNCDATHARVALETHLGRRWFCRHTRFEEHPHFLWSEVFAVMYSIELIRFLTKSAWMPARIMIRSQQSELFRSVLDQPVQLFVAQEMTALSVAEKELQSKVNIPSIFPAQAAPVIEWHSSFTDSVFTALQPYIKEHVLTIDNACVLLKITPRTLQRRLKEENTSFRKLKDSLMFSLSCELMAKGHSLTYIASQLGYANLSHFSRAFKRISGITPKLYKTTSL